jgi:hypothetical protein
MANMQQMLDQLNAGVRGAHTRLAEHARGLNSQTGDIALVRQELQRQQRELQNLADALSSVKGVNGGGGGPIEMRDGETIFQEHIMYISQIPGRRVPFDLLVTIPIGSDVRSVQQATSVISQDGPFVGVARYCTFQSTYQFTEADPDTGSTTTFQGRTFGRFRPVHSVNDYNDSQAFNPITGIAAPGTGAPIYASPSNHSGFRSMEFDGIIKFLNQGSAYPRSNVEVPSSLWVGDNNNAFQLGALDFFERGETLQWEVTPQHVNNPPAGNVQQFTAGGVFPTLDSQYDVHEGILDQADPNVTTDPISRLPQGLLIIGIHGFKIIQPPGPVRLV